MADVDTYDAVIVGGGINGASIFQTLAHAGYRVLLVDRGDFSSGTSQGSAMLIWGGLLYLRDLELRTVLRLSAARDALIRQGGAVHPQVVRYVTERGGRSRAFVQSVLYAYWALGGFRRRRPRFERAFAERSLLDASRVRGALTYEEGRVDASDARFVLSCILAARNDRAVARNHCGLMSGSFNPRAQTWRLQLRGASWSGEVETRVVINAAGGWTDELNARFKRTSPWRHVLSKGVSICIPRDARHVDVIACDAARGGTAMSLVPWGPVSLWGSTDSVHADLRDASSITRADLEQLLGLLNTHFTSPVSVRDIVSLRCGVRGLAVPAAFKPAGDLTRLSRHHRVHVDPVLPWISVYGGKLSGCRALAADVRRRVENRIGVAPFSGGSNPSAPATAPNTEAFPTLRDPVIPVAWSVEHELCGCLADYLRRRTNIAQWVPRGGLGRHLEHLEHIRGLARVIHRGDAGAAERDLTEYRAAVDRHWGLLDPNARVHQERSPLCIH